MSWPWIARSNFSAFDLVFSANGAMILLGFRGKKRKKTIVRFSDHFGPARFNWAFTLGPLG